MKILITNDYGAGWATWNTEKSDVADFMLTYQPIIDYIEKFENGEHDLNAEHSLVLQMVEEIKQKFNREYVCVLGAENLIVKSVHDHYPSLLEVYKIDNYDGWENMR